MNVKQIKKAKKGFDEGKNLETIIRDDSLQIDAKQLNALLIKKYGTDTIGNPLQELKIEKRADMIMEKALSNLPPEKLIAKLEKYIEAAKK